MGFNRPEAKYHARMAMRGAYPHPMLVTLVYMLLTSVLLNVIMYFVANPFSIGYLYLLEGERIENIYRYIFTPGRVGVYLLVELLTTLYLWVMSYGYASYALRLARKEVPGYRNLFDGFYNLGRALLVSFLTALFATLWGMLGMLPGFVVMMVAAFAGSGPLVVVGAILMIAGAVVEIIALYRYRLAVYFLLDDPDMGALAAITASKQAMRGHKGELFVMDLSFLGWAILSLFTLGILSLWLNPYMWASEANFYDWVVHGTYSDGSGQQPNDPFLPPQNGGYHSPYDGPQV